MHINKRTIATTQLVLIFPAALFMVALLVRYLQPLLYEPTHTAQLIVMWYSGRVWTLWVLLIGLPLAVLVIGCVTLMKGWIIDTKPQQTIPQLSAKIRLHPAMLMIVTVTLVAALVLAVVAVHMLMN